MDRWARYTAGMPLVYLARTRLFTATQVKPLSTTFGNLRGRDPMDMLILAQAANEGVDLYTSDMELLDMGLDFVKDSTL
jgi:PIN domain nuclease of toxin-antitoxin system